MITNYFSISENVGASYKSKNSKFIAYAFPLPDLEFFKTQLDKIKLEHPKATHFCYAYRFGVDGTNFRSNDDGEPSGSAGKPILGQIDSFNLTNVAIVVVRYYGGTNLGVPGLISAYKESAKLAIKNAQIIQYDIFKYIELKTEYADLSKIIKWIESVKGIVLEIKMDINCIVLAKIPIMMTNIEKSIPFGININWQLKDENY